MTEEQLKQAIVTAEAKGDQRAAASAWHALGEWMEPLRPDEDAAACFGRAQALRPPEGLNPHEEVAAYHERALLAFCARDYEAAASLAQQGIALAAEAGLARKRALLLYQKGRAVRRLPGRPAEGERLLLEAEGLLQAEPLWLAATMEEQAWAALADKRPEDALELLERVLALRDGHEAPWAISHACHEIGRLLLEVARPEEALAHLLRAVEIREAHGIDLARFSYHELGRCYGALRDLEAAGRWYSQSIALDLAAKEPLEAGITLHCWAVNGLETGDYDLAVAKSEEAIQHRTEGADPNVRFSYWILGRAERLRGRLDEAKAAIHTHATLSREQGDAAEEVDAFLELGDITAQQGDEEGARTWYERALSMAPAFPALMTRTLLALGWQAYRQDDQEGALGYFQQVLAHEEQTGNREEMAETCRLIGDVLVDYGDLPTAITWYERAAAIHQELGAPIREAGMFRRIGRLQHQLQDWGQAHATLLRALDLDLAANSDNVSDNYFALGHVDNMRGNLTSAVDWFELCFALEEKRGDSSAAAITARTLANLVLSTGAESPAWEWLRRATDLHTAAEDWEEAAETWVELAQLLRAQEDAAGAAEALNTAISILEKAGLRRTEPLFQMGHLAFDADPHMAATWYEQALAVALEQQNLAAAAGACYWSGRVARSIGDLASADLWLEKALAYSESANDPVGQAVVAREIGKLRAIGRDFAAARQWLEQARSLQQELKRDVDVAAILDDLAQIDLADGRPARASEHLQQALTLLEHTDQIGPLSGITFRLGRALAHQGDLEGARPMLERSLAYDQQLGDRNGEAITCLELAAVALSDESYDEARTWLDQCLQTGIPAEEPGAMAALQFRYGQIAEAEDDLPQAETRYLAALESDPSDHLEAASALSLGRIHSVRGESAGARIWFERALAAAERSGDDELMEEARLGLEDSPQYN